jgi:cell division protein FtsZ
MTEYHKNILKHDYRFEMRQITLTLDEQQPIIKVIGVGGAGGNAVNHMLTNKNIKGVEYVVCNTDRQALVRNPVEHKIQLGAELLKGLGAGTDAATGRKAAEESIEFIRDVMQPPIQMVFVTAGMGGGTGTGAAPIVAQIAREMGMLTVAVVTAPRNGEGRLKKKQAIEGINLLKQHCDTVLVILNDELAKLHGNIPRSRADQFADDVLANAVKSIAEIITIDGRANSDFMDVKRILENAGTSVMASATSSGENRAIEAIEEALRSPLLNNRDIKGAKRILITLTSSTEHEATYDDETAISQYMARLIGDETDQTKIGAIIDDSLGDKLQVTVIAAGFEDSHLPFTDDGFYNEKTKTVIQIPVVPPVIEKPAVVIDPIVIVAPPIIPVKIEPIATPEIVKSEISIVTETEHHAKIETNSGGSVATIIKLPPKDTHIESELLQKAATIEDLTAVNQMIQDIFENKYTERVLDEPAYIRQKVVFTKKPALHESKFIRVNLDSIPKS